MLLGDLEERGLSRWVKGRSTGGRGEQLRRLCSVCSSYCLLNPEEGGIRARGIISPSQFGLPDPTGLSFQAGMSPWASNLSPKSLWLSTS